jgi:DNA-binding SARP family transcriptional activator/Flp pilus assembly protein TadD
MRSELRLFGGLSLYSGGQPVSGAAAQPRRLAVLAVLAEACPEAVSRDRLIGLLWPDQDEGSARRLLTQALYELRRELGDFTQPGAGREIAIDPARLCIDLVEFRAALRSGRSAAAAAIARGPLLDGFHLRGSVAFEQWSSEVRDAVDRDVRRAIAQVVHDHAGSPREALQWGERLVAAAPYDSAALIQLIELAERAGDPGVAHRAVATYARRSREDLALEPDPAVARRLATMAIATEPSLPLGHSPVAVPVAPPVPDAGAIRGRRFGPRSMAIGLSVLASLALILGLRWGGSATPSIAITVAANSSTDVDAATAVRTTLAAIFTGAGGLSVDTSGRSGAADVVIQTAVTASPVVVRLDAELTDRRNGHVSHASATGSPDSLIVLAERISLHLLPGLYPGLSYIEPTTLAARFTGAGAARRYLDGEVALRRGAFETAYAAFRAATELEPTAAYAWFRRAVAAEDAHRIDDADSSALTADRLAGTVSRRDAALIHAYATWRAGDTRAADSLFRRLVSVSPNDGEAWFGFAEVAYHGGPLMGRTLDDARDPWRRAVMLDSTSFPAIMHLVRLEARAGDLAAVRALTRRADALHPDEPFSSEVRTIALAAEVAAGTRPFDRSVLEALPDASVLFVHSIVASFLERPDLARVVAIALTDRARPSATRAGGFVALAHLAIAEGKLREADCMLDSVARYNPATAATWRAYFASLPFLPQDSAATRAALAGVEAMSAQASDAPLYLEIAVDADAASIIRRYTTSLMTAQVAGITPAQMRCDRLTEPTASLCLDLARGIETETLRASTPHAALARLEAMSFRVPYQLAGRSVYFARSRERFLRAELLARVGRVAEAEAWYGAAPHEARMDYVYLAPSHLARGRIREQRGDFTEAARHYRQVISLWRDADPSIAALRRQAEEGLRRVGG